MKVLNVCEAEEYRLKEFGSFPNVFVVNSKVLEVNPHYTEWLVTSPAQVPPSLPDVLSPVCRQGSICSRLGVDVDAAEKKGPNSAADAPTDTAEIDERRTSFFAVVFGTGKDTVTGE